MTGKRYLGKRYTESDCKDGQKEAFTWFYLKAIINSIGKARENSRIKKDMKGIKKMLKFFLEIIIKEKLLDDRKAFVYNNKNTTGKA